jgi:hypothetical protein
LASCDVADFVHDRWPLILKFIIPGLAYDKIMDCYLFSVIIRISFL